MTPESNPLNLGPDIAREVLVGFKNLKREPSVASGKHRVVTFLTAAIKVIGTNVGEENSLNLEVLEEFLQSLKVKHVRAEQVEDLQEICKGLDPLVNLSPADSSELKVSEEVAAKLGKILVGKGQGFWEKLSLFNQESYNYQAGNLFYNAYLAMGKDEIEKRFVADLSDPNFFSSRNIGEEDLTNLISNVLAITNHADMSRVVFDKATNIRWLENNSLRSPIIEDAKHIDPSFFHCSILKNSIESAPDADNAVKMLEMFVSSEGQQSLVNLRISNDHLVELFQAAIRKVATSGEDKGELIQSIVNTLPKISELFDSETSKYLDIIDSLLLNSAFAAQILLIDEGGQKIQDVLRKSSLDPDFVSAESGQVNVLAKRFFTKAIQNPEFNLMASDLEQLKSYPKLVIQIVQDIFKNVESKSGELPTELVSMHKTRANQLADSIFEKDPKWFNEHFRDQTEIAKSCIMNASLKTLLPYVTTRDMFNLNIDRRALPCYLLYRAWSEAGKLKAGEVSRDFRSYCLALIADDQIPIFTGLSYKNNAADNLKIFTLLASDKNSHLQLKQSRAQLYNQLKEVLANEKAAKVFLQDGASLLKNIGLIEEGEPNISDNRQMLDSNGKALGEDGLEYFSQMASATAELVLIALQASGQKVDVLSLEALAEFGLKNCKGRLQDELKKRIK